MSIRLHPQMMMSIRLHDEMMMSIILHHEMMMSISLHHQTVMSFRLLRIFGQSLSLERAEIFFYYRRCEDFSDLLRAQVNERQRRKKKRSRENGKGQLTNIRRNRLRRKGGIKERRGWGGRKFSFFLLEL
ncbi:hypothetical protein CEXT_431171 [Caerostris extrusa]|uniref:Uncharacterized protein n=1 Tax=Caerostris extrusa TaxID=172846 RepID=A0AAV4NAE8_CAEEX|nr:hypothetical protein CEXT_431171 [Caerostris extrusa]